MKYILTLLTLFVFTFTTNAQFGNLGKKLEKKVNKKIENKIDKTIDKGLDKTEETIEESVKGDKKDEDDKDSPTSTKGSEKTSTPSGNETGTKANTVNENDSGFNYSTKFDFVPGDKILTFYDFKNDYVGDLPAGWNTNGSASLVKINDSDEKWLKLRSKSVYIPDLPSVLPGDYTIEFDLNFDGLSSKTTSNAFFWIILDDNNAFDDGSSYAKVGISPCQYASIPIRVRGKKEGAEFLKNEIGVDLRKILLNQPHVSIAVNQQRFRLWINEEKYVDIPRFITPGKVGYLKFYVDWLNSEKGENVFMRNVKIAEGGTDLRKKLMDEGRISTTGILFNVNSDIVKPESYGVIRNIFQVMDNNAALKLNIIGHTDSDGDDASNLDLSKRRAESVKQVLVKDFGITSDRLTTEGKGETEPVTQNDTPINKASNRRVEFVVIK